MIGQGMEGRSGARTVAGAAAGGPSGPRGGLLLALLLLSAVLAGVVAGWRPMAAESKNAPVSRFSGERALEVLRALEGDGAPHPVGSEANARVRERILAHLRWLGYLPEVQEETVCTSFGVCATVKNVLARLPGLQGGKSALLLAHYDSVPAGPGASDDMSGTAVLLEVARVLKGLPTPRHGILLLITDGEEAGLLGAQAFVEKSPAFREVGAVANFEARGTGGPSLMFETSGPDAWLVPLWAAQASRPFTSSLFSTIYDAMPNDTDLTLFKARGVPGLNFAFIGNPRHYHTPLDSAANASAATLQHHGDNALAAARALAAADLDHPRTGKAVFFDLFRRWVVRWPAGWSPIFAGLGLVLVLFARLRGGRQRERGEQGGLVAGLLAPLAGGLAAGLAGFAVRWLLTRAFPEPWIAEPGPETTAFWLAGLAAALASLALLTLRRPGFLGVWSGVWLFWGGAGLALSLTYPGLCFLFVVPVLAAGLVGVLGLPRSSGGAVRLFAALLPALAAALLWFPVLVNLYAGLGLTGLLGAALLLGLFLSTLAPLAGVAGTAFRRGVPLLAAAGALVAVFLGLRTPPFSADAPRALNLAFHQEAGSAAGRWLFRASGEVPPEMAKAAQFGKTAVLAYPWSSADTKLLAAPAPPLAVPAPELTVLADETADGKRHLRLRLVSPRGALLASLLVPQAAKLESIRIGGVEVPGTGESKGARLRAALPPPPFRAYHLLTLPPQGSEIDAVLGESGPLDWYVADRTYGLPASGQALLAARPKTAGPVQEGDTTIVSRKVRL